MEHLKPKCVIKENYTPPSSKFSAILNSMLREKVPKFDLVSGDHAIGVVITATIISTGMACVLRYCQIWMGRRGGDSWWHGPAICQNLGAKLQGMLWSEHRGKHLCHQKLECSLCHQNPEEYTLRFWRLRVWILACIPLLAKCCLILQDQANILAKTKNMR